MACFTMALVSVSASILLMRVCMCSSTRLTSALSSGAPGHENHGFFSQDAYRVEKLINSVACPNFGALIDMGNFLCADVNTIDAVKIAVAGILSIPLHQRLKTFFYAGLFLVMFCMNKL